MMEAMTGFLGNRVLINGKADHTLSVDRSVYRIRVLNGSNARIYKLAWGNETPLTVIDTDGGLLEEPVTKPNVMCWDLENVSMRNYLVEKSN
jgi:blue copper oxidase